MEKHLHIISLTVPYPVDYGGVFDLFYKLPALQKLGVQIHLHCFDYGRGVQQELNKYCTSVNYYSRNTKFFSSLPYIVNSRKNDQLLNDLLQDEHPILMEGVHCTYLLNDHRFANRKIFVRLHNVEFEYYNGLKKTATSFFKKIYYKREAALLYNYENRIANRTNFWSVTEKDAETYRETFGCRNISYLPLFLPGWKVNSKEGKGDYCLYHGDLSVDANEKAALWLIEKVFDGLDSQLIIAGKKPSSKLVSKKNIRIVANPSEGELKELIERAHINILPSLTNTGIKLKLINALYNGRHIICNNATVEGTGFETLCNVVEDADALKQMVSQLYSKKFTASDIEARKRLLNDHFDNDKNALEVVRRIWGV